MKSILNRKKGQSTLFLIIPILGLLIMLVFLFVGGVLAVKVNGFLDQSIQLGQVNLQTINAQTFGKFATMYLQVADWWGMCAIIGMILGLFLSAYFTRGKFPKFGIIIDIIIIVAMFFAAQYFAATYSTLLDALAGAGETFLEVYTPKTSAFMVNLHIYIVIIGAIMMFLFHSSLPKRPEEKFIGEALGGI